MEFVDKALARRLEACEEMPQVLYARAFQEIRPETGAEEQEICGGHMIFAGLGSPIGRATGLGFDRHLTADDLDRVEEFYRKHGAPVRLQMPTKLGYKQAKYLDTFRVTSVLKPGKTGYWEDQGYSWFGGL